MAPQPTPREEINIRVKDRTPYQQYTRTLWGQSPYPSLKAPSPEQAAEVHKRLMAAHGDRLRPAHITAPSLDIAGCGEVPQVLDAIIRTMISANTQFRNADRAVRKLRGKVGIISERLELDDLDGPGLNQCLDYNFILMNMTEEELGVATSPAGGQKKFAPYALAILKDVLAINKERAEAFREELSDGGVPADPAKIMAADALSVEEKQWEIRMFERGILNLEFLKKVSPEAAMDKMLGWTGVGVKTAACVLLFCMQEDILACDTHCIRLSKWLGWAPVEAEDNLVFAHVDSRVPDNLKYGLHQLFIQHGKDCLKCQMKTNESTKGWAEAVCVLEDLLDRVPIEKHTAELKARERARKEEVRNEHKARKEEARKEKARKKKGGKEGMDPVEAKSEEEEEVDGEEGDSEEDETDGEKEDSLDASKASLKRQGKAQAGGNPVATGKAATKSKAPAKGKAPAKAKTAANRKAGSTQTKKGEIAQTAGTVKKPNVDIAATTQDDPTPRAQTDAAAAQTDVAAATAAYDGPITRKRTRNSMGTDVDIGTKDKTDHAPSPPHKKNKAGASSKQPNTSQDQHVATPAAATRQTRAQAKQVGNQVGKE